jgi:hypothetical protein
MSDRMSDLICYNPKHRQVLELLFVMATAERECVLIESLKLIVGMS